MTRSGYTFIAPLLLLMFAAFNAPLVYMLGMGFWSKGGGFTTEHYAALTDAPVYLRVLAGTVRVSVVSTIANVALGYPLAYWMRSLGPKGQLVAVALVITPFWISVSNCGNGWQIRNATYNTESFYCYETVNGRL